MVLARRSLRKGKGISMSAPTWASLRSTGVDEGGSRVGFSPFQPPGAMETSTATHVAACVESRTRLSAGSIKSRCATPSTCSAALIADRQTDTPARRGRLT